MNAVYQIGMGEIGGLLIIEWIILIIIVCVILAYIIGRSRTKD